MGNIGQVVMSSLPQGPPCGGDSSESTHFILDGFPLRGRPNHQAEKANKKLNKWVWGSEKNPSCKFGIY